MQHVTRSYNYVFPVFLFRLVACFFVCFVSRFFCLFGVFLSVQIQLWVKSLERDFVTSLIDL